MKILTKQTRCHAEFISASHLINKILWQVQDNNLLHVYTQNDSRKWLGARLSSSAAYLFVREQKRSGSVTTPELES